MNDYIVGLKRDEERRALYVVVKKNGERFWLTSEGEKHEHPISSDIEQGGNLVDELHARMQLYVQKHSEEDVNAVGHLDIKIWSPGTAGDKLFGTFSFYGIMKGCWEIGDKMLDSLLPPDFEFVHRSGQTTPLSKKEIMPKPIKTKEKTMSELDDVIAKVYDKTEDAMLVSTEVHKNGEMLSVLFDPFIEELIIRQHRDEILAEMKRRKKEREAKNVLNQG